MRHAILIALLTASCSLTAGESVAAAVDARIQRFEKSIETAFGPVRNQLDGWRSKRGKDAQAAVAAALPKAGPRDQVYLAYHLLSFNPKHVAARKVFTDLGLPPPFDDAGKPAEGFRAPRSDTAQAVALALEMRYPAFDAVTRAVDLRGSVAAPFWKKLTAEQDALRKDLQEIATERIAEQAAQVVYPLLAYYQPRAEEVTRFYAATGKPMPQQRTWFNPVDRWLLDRELAGLDALRPVGTKAGTTAPWYGSGGGDLPATIPGAVVEVQASWRGSAEVTLAGPASAAPVTWRLSGRTLTISGGGAKPVKTSAELEVDLASEPLAVQCEVRGSRATFAVGGIVVASLDLPQSVALKQWRVNGLDDAKLLRVRYLNTGPDLLDEAPARPVTPPVAAADPAWKAERAKALGSEVSCEFADLQLSEVVAALSRITGTSFRLGASAEPLQDLPVTMSARGVPLRTALDWLQRLAELEAVPDEQGFRLEWKR